MLNPKPQGQQVVWKSSLPSHVEKESEQLSDPSLLRGWMKFYMRLWMCSTLLQDGQICSTSLQESTQNGIRQQGQMLHRGTEMRVTAEQRNQWSLWVLMCRAAELQASLLVLPDSRTTYLNTPSPPVCKVAANTFTQRFFKKAAVLFLSLHLLTFTLWLVLKLCYCFFYCNCIFISVK